MPDYLAKVHRLHHRITTQLGAVREPSELPTKGASRRVICGATMRGASSPDFPFLAGEDIRRKLTDELRKTRELNPHYYESRLSFQDSATNQHPPIFQVVGLTQPRAHRHSHHPAGSFMLLRSIRRTVYGVQHAVGPTWLHPSCSVRSSEGLPRTRGIGEIRTPGSFKGYTTFPRLHHRPLGHDSKRCGSSIPQ